MKKSRYPRSQLVIVYAIQKPIGAIRTGSADGQQNDPRAATSLAADR